MDWPVPHAIANPRAFDLEPSGGRHLTCQQRGGKNQRCMLDRRNCHFISF